MKRFAAPAFWPLEKKTKKFVVEPRPGPHPKGRCIPLGVAIRDMLGYAKNLGEIKIILNQGHAKIDGVVRKEKGFPLGLMDVLSIGDDHYRIVPGHHGLRMIPIEKNESHLKLLRIENKTYVKNRKLQLNFHDGKNLLVEKDDYHTGDVIIFDTTKKTVKEIIHLKKGALALIIGGNNIGSLCYVEDIIITKSSMPNQVVVSLDERKITLPRNYVFVVGKEAPALKIGE